jgi:hypothetical protein
MFWNTCTKFLVHKRHTFLVQHRWPRGWLLAFALIHAHAARYECRCACKSADGAPGLSTPLASHAGQSSMKRYLYIGTPDAAQSNYKSGQGILIFDVDQGTSSCGASTSNSCRPFGSYLTCSQRRKRSIASPTALYKVRASKSTHVQYRPNPGMKPDIASTRSRNAEFAVYSPT